MKEFLVMWVLIPFVLISAAFIVVLVVGTLMAMLKFPR